MGKLNENHVGKLKGFLDFRDDGFLHNATEFATNMFAVTHRYYVLYETSDSSLTLKINVVSIL